MLLFTRRFFSRRIKLQNITPPGIGYLTVFCANVCSIVHLLVRVTRTQSTYDASPSTWDLLGKIRNWGRPKEIVQTRHNRPESCVASLRRHHNLQTSGYHHNTGCTLNHNSAPRGTGAPTTGQRCAESAQTAWNNKATLPTEAWSFLCQAASSSTT